MIGVSPRVVLKCTLTEPELEMISRLLNPLIEGRKQEKKQILHAISIYIFKKAFCPMVNTFTLTYFREKAGKLICGYCYVTAQVKERANWTVESKWKMLC